MKQSNKINNNLQSDRITALYLRLSRDDDLDCEKGDDDFTPFRNIMNEWYAKDMSRKMRSILKLKSS